LKALGSLRLEKGYRDFGHDVDNTDTLVEAGLSFTCNFDKGDFIGRDSVLAEKARNKSNGGSSKRMLQVLVEDETCWLHHGEVVTRDGVALGEMRAGSHGHTVGGAVGLVMIETPDSAIVNKSYVNSGDWKIIVGNETYPIKVSITPFYDPKNLKIKC